MPLHELKMGFDSLIVAIVGIWAFLLPISLYLDFLLFQLHAMCRFTKTMSNNNH